MSLYTYKKKVNNKKKKVISKLSYVTLTLGALLLFWSFYPVVSFQIYSKVFLENKILAPVPKEAVASSISLGNSVWGENGKVSSNLRDFTQASLWFPTQPKINTAQIENASVPINQYYLSIPKLNIERAVVKTKGEDLAGSLIHFLPTSLPGEYGNVAILGHSTLPQLYNVKDYKTIFTYLPSLDRGDKIVISLNDYDYEYEIFEMFVVKPEEVSVLEQKYDDSYITLITCVPPGTYWNRLIVRARLTKLPGEL